MITWSPRGKARFLGCIRRIAEECQDRQAAARWIDRVYTAVESLERDPLSGRVVPEIGRADIRETRVGDDRIIFRVRNDSPEILSIRHGRFRVRTT